MVARVSASSMGGKAGMRIESSLDDEVGVDMVIRKLPLRNKGGENEMMGVFELVVMEKDLVKMK